MSKSDRNTKKAPNTKPITAGINANCPSFPKVVSCPASSIAGANRDQYEAAIITPLENPKLPSNSFLCNGCNNNKIHIIMLKNVIFTCVPLNTSIKLDPIAVRPHVNKVPKRVWTSGLKFGNIFQTQFRRYQPKIKFSSTRVCQIGQY